MSSLRSRVAVFLGPGTPFEIREYSVPDPRPGAILVKIRLTNLCGSDLHQWRGDGGSNIPPGGRVLGHEMVGEVAALGDGVETDSLGNPLRVGDRIVYAYFYPCRRCPACTNGQFHLCPNRLSHSKDSADDWPHLNGGFADYYYLRPGHFVFKVPDELSDAMVAPANCALSQVIHSLRQAPLGFGETLVIQGAGALGVYAAAVARTMGASRIIAIDRIPDRLKLAAEFGADDVICNGDFPTPEARVERVKELTGGLGAHAVLEVVGHPDVIPEGLAMLRSGGSYLEVGMVSAKFSFQMFPSALLRQNARFIGINQYAPMVLSEALEFLKTHGSRFPFDRILSHSFPLAEINQAFEGAEWFGRAPDRPGMFRVALVP